MRMETLVWRKIMTCKYMKSENWTPSDYDISFDIGEVPANIESVSSMDLKKTLDMVTPLSRRIHLNLLNSEERMENHVSITSRLLVNGERIK